MLNKPSQDKKLRNRESGTADIGNSPVKSNSIVN